MFSYKPLWKTLIDRNLKKEDLRLGIQTSPSTISKMGKNKQVALDVIDRICDFLECSIEEVIEHVPVNKLVRLYIENLENEKQFIVEDIQNEYLSYDLSKEAIQNCLEQLRKERMIKPIYSLDIKNLEIKYIKITGKEG